MVHGWSQRAGDASTQSAYSAAVDASGNVVVIGEFEGTVDFGGGVLTSAGAKDIYIAKFDAAGNHLWSQRFGDTSSQYAKSTAVDASGNIVVLGWFYGTVDFGGGVLTSAGSNDIYIAKFDAAGNHLWSLRFGDTSSQYTKSTTVDASGNIFVTGYFQGTVDFGGGVLTSAGSDDIYIAKFDAAGTHLWSQRFGDASPQYANSAAVDGLGNVVVTGIFLGTVNFGGGLLTSASAFDIFIVKFNAAGNHIWSDSYGDPSSTEYSTNLSVDGMGNVFVAGYFPTTVDFGGGVLTSAGGYDIFIVKLDTSGSHLWSQSFGDANGQRAYTAALDGSGNVFLTGYFNGTTDFGGGVLTSVGGNDIFIVKLDTYGNHIWSQRFGDANNQYAYSAAVEGVGNVIVAGEFQGIVDFGGGGLISAGAEDIHFAKFWRAAPEIYAVRDIPGDQGGLVNVSWDASGVDTPGEHVVTRYTIWRAIAPTLVSEMIARGVAVVSNPSAVPSKADGAILRMAQLGSATYYWKLITSVDAYYLEGYSEQVATLFDSTEVSTEYHYFQVIAHTSDPFVFWASSPDSGYSVDNFAPGAPLALAGKQSVAPDGLNITWAPNTEADLSHYAVYRGTSEGFTPGTGNLIASPQDTTSFDGGWSWSYGYYYKVSAFDVHGNESPFALLTPEDVTGSGDSPLPLAFYLEQNHPNPFTASTRIAFGIGETTDVSLNIYDISGRLVRVLIDGNRDARRYETLWDGIDNKGQAVASGVYFYRLTAGNRTLTKKMLLLK
jgi:hypothetical protein